MMMNWPSNLTRPSSPGSRSVNSSRKGPLLLKTLTRQSTRLSASRAEGRRGVGAEIDLERAKECFDGGILEATVTTKLGFPIWMWYS